MSLVVIEDLSEGKENVPVPAEWHDSDCTRSNVSRSPPFPPFQYITRNLIPPQAAEPFYDGCTCQHSCLDMPSACACTTIHTSAYTQMGFLKLESPPIYECNSNCTCPPTCANRVVQHGLKAPLCVFKHNSKKGWGVRTLSVILVGAFVAEYAGEVIGTKEAERRWTEMTKTGSSNYILCLREYGPDGQVYRTNIDPSRFGNVGRFISHSCNPNLAMHIARIDSIVPSAALFALRDIQPGEELTFDYGGSASLNWAETGDGATGNAHGGRIECLCGSSNCRKYLPYDPAL
ncbi:histone-lysine N-methyltransferase [Spizellomyces sp. 'palustris']|nr:histone-lysine N-methyltransferase [Spizellomyces sp. 'palustris']